MPAENSLNPYAIPLHQLTESGRVPESRLTDPGEVRSFVDILIRTNTKRSLQNARVKGLIDGNPPFRPDDRRKAGLAHLSNFNDRTAEAFVRNAISSYYDVVTEVPTVFEVGTKYGNVDQRTEWSRIITQHFDWLNRQDSRFDYFRQNSIYQMTVFGLGPVMWEDTTDWRCIPVMHSSLLLPEGSKANLDDWEVAVVLMDYQPHHLYGFIRNEDAARSAGWDVAAVKQAIIEAAPAEYVRTEIGRNWEFIQQRIRNNDLSYSVRSSVVSVAHVFYKEFPKDGQQEGRITHRIIQQATQQGGEAAFLFSNIGRYEKWQHVICPFYYDRGDESGTHHSVKGMGVKFYNLLESQIKLKNMSVDLAVAQAQLLMKPVSESARQQFQIVSAGPFGIVPSGYEAVPMNFSNRMDGVMGVQRELMQTTTSNLSQYRQFLSDKAGNPITATEAQAKEINRGVLNRTELNRFYEQWDDVGAERYRRATNPNIPATSPHARLALEFQRKCREDGVPAAALAQVDFVRATRVSGQGSSFLRQQAIKELLAVSGMFPETTRMRIVEDYTAATVGQNASERYPVDPEEALPDRNVWDAMMENAAFKQGASATWTPAQNNFTHAQMHMQAAGQALGSLQQGGNPLEIVAFMDAAGPNIAIHLQKLAGDPVRAEAARQMDAQFKQMAGVVDQLRRQLEQQAQQQAEAAQQQQEQAQPDPEKEMRAQKVGQDMQLDAAAAQQDMQLQQARVAQDLQIAAAKAQQDMMLKEVQARAKIAATKKGASK